MGQQVMRLRVSALRERPRLAPVGQRFSVYVSPSCNRLFEDSEALPLQLSGLDVDPVALKGLGSETRLPARPRAAAGELQLQLRC